MSLAAPSIVLPAFASTPSHVSTAGAEAADLAALSGFVPDAEQRLILDAIYAQQTPGSSFQSGQWAALEVAIIAARQNVKTSSMLMAALADLFLFDARLVIWTAHLFQTAAEAFLDFKHLIDGNAHLSRKVRKITEAAGNQGVELMSGGRIRFLARSKASGRGMSGDAVFFDEAYALTAAELGALIPTLSARPNPSVRYGSSAGRMESEVLRNIRDRGRAGGDPSLAYVEWCSTAECASASCEHTPGYPGCVLDDPSEWQKANPAMGRRIEADYIASERRALTPAEFARERLGWWDEPRGGTVIPMSKWAPLARNDGVIVGAVALFVDVALDRSQSVIGVCGENDRGVPQVEVAVMADGTDWVSEKVADMVARHDVLAVGARSAGPVASLLPDLRGVCDDASVSFVKMGSTEFAGACGGFYDAAMTSALAHLGDSRIDLALASARKHQVLDAWSWERTKVDVDAAPLVAVSGSHALYLQHRDDAATYDPALSVW